MKRNSLSTFFVFLYMNIWYIPFLAFILGAKVSLISYLVSRTVQQRDHRNEHLTSEIIRIIQLQKDQQRRVPTSSRISKRSFSIPSPIPPKSPLTPQDLAELEHLEHVTINPTALNRTDPQGIWLVFNQVPRGGGEVISALLEDLQEENKFKYTEHEYRTPWPRFLLEEEQSNLVSWFQYQHRPVAYDRHFYFVNFTAHQKYILDKPIYVNMLQNPASRLLAEFQWKRTTKDKAQAEVERRNGLELGSGSAWLALTFDDCVLHSDPECSWERGKKDFTLSLPFFCGQHNSCVTIEDKWALQMAKFNIEKYYSVVGVLERLEDSLAVLHNYIPTFFAGAENYDVEKPVESGSISPEALQVLKRKLGNEFELYAFISHRLSLQRDFIKAKEQQQSPVVLA